MRLHQIVFLPPAPVVAAQHLRAFERAGVTVETTVTRSSVQQRQGLLDGRYDIAATASDNVFSWNAQGGDFCIVAQIERTTLLQIFANAGWDALRQEPGPRVAVDAPDSGFVLVLRDVLARQGVLVTDARLVPLGGVKERLDGLVRGDADIGLLSPPFDVDARAAGLQLLATVEEFHPAYPGLGLVARRSRLDEIGPALQAYLRALSEALAWMEAKPASAVGALVAAGFAPAAAEAVMQTRATSLRPSADGLALVRDIRRREGKLPPDAGPVDALLQTRFVDALAGPAVAGDTSPPVLGNT